MMMLLSRKRRCDCRKGSASARVSRHGDDPSDVALVLLMLTAHCSKSLSDWGRSEKMDTPEVSLVVVTPLGRHLSLVVGQEDTAQALRQLLERAGITPAATPDYEWALVESGRKGPRLALTCFRRPHNNDSHTSSSTSTSTRDDDDGDVPAAVAPYFLEAYHMSVNWVGAAQLSGSEGWVALGWNDIATIARHTAADARAAAAMTVVDLGSGTGSAMLGLGAHGFGRVVGIELDARLVACSRDLIARVEQHAGRGRTRFEVVAGSYYTRDLALDYLAGTCWAAQQQGTRDRRACEERLLHVVQNTAAVDAAVRRALRSADVVCAFLWSVQVASVMELFVRHARPDATLVVANSNRRVAHPDLLPIAEFQAAPQPHGPSPNSSSSTAGWRLATHGFPITFYRRRNPRPRL